MKIKIKIIALLLWIVIWWGFFITQQISSRVKFQNEVAKINEQIKAQIKDKEKQIQEWILADTKKEVVDLLKREDFVVIKDYYKTYENFYNRLLKTEKYKDYIKTKEFLDSPEYKILETLKWATLVTEAHVDWEKKYFNGVPNNMNCSELKLNAPCIKNSNIPPTDKFEVVFVEKTFSDEEIYEILNWDYKKFF